MNKFLVLRSKSSPVSFLIERKVSLILVSLLITTIIIVFLLSLGMGEMKIPITDVVKTLFGRGPDESEIVIKFLRLPRIIIAFLVGAFLAASGAILQGIVRNPLASPDIIGITGGASIASVAFIIYGSGQISIKWLPVITITGAWFASMLIYSLAWKKGVTPIRLVLVGIGIAAAMSAVTTLMILVSPIYSSSQAYIWLAGSIYGANWENVLMQLPWFLVFIPLAFIYRRNINVQQLGDEVATSMGSSVQKQRLTALFISVSLAGSAVAVAGAIAFVGLIAPHIARKLVGSAMEGQLPVAILIGGLIVLLADLIARTAFLPLDVPAGVFISGIGAPFFIYLLFRNRNRI